MEAFITRSRASPGRREHDTMATKPSKLTKDGKRAKQLPRASVVVSALPIGG